MSWNKEEVESEVWISIFGSIWGRGLRKWGQGVKEIVTDLLWGTMGVDPAAELLIFCRTQLRIIAPEVNKILRFTQPFILD